LLRGDYPHQWMKIVYRPAAMAEELITGAKTELFTRAEIDSAND